MWHRSIPDLVTNKEAVSFGEGGTDNPRLGQCDPLDGFDNVSSSGASVLVKNPREQSTFALDTTEEQSTDEGPDHYYSFHCHVCQTIFENADQFNRHDCKKVPEEPVKKSCLPVADHWVTPFKCATCNARFRSHQLCVAHVFKEHKSTVIQHRIASVLPGDLSHGSSREEQASQVSKLPQEQGSKKPHKDAQRANVMMCKLCQTFYTSQEACLAHIKMDHEKTKYVRPSSRNRDISPVQENTLSESIGYFIEECSEASRKNNEKENCAKVTSDHLADPHGSKSPVSGSCEDAEVCQGSSTVPEDNSSTVGQDCEPNSVEVVCEAANLLGVNKAKTLSDDVLDSEGNNLKYVDVIPSQGIDTGTSTSCTNMLSLAAVSFLFSDGIQLKKCFVKLSGALCHLCNTNFPTNEELLMHVYAVHEISIGPDSGGSSVKLRRSSIKRKRRYFGNKKRNMNMNFPFLYTTSPDKPKQAKTDLKPGSAGKKSVFICPVCASSFPSFDACEDHMKLFHIIDSNVPVAQKWSSRSQPLVVSLPDKDSKFNLEAITCQHNAQNQTFLCASCGQEFATFSSFSQHAITDHTPNPREGLKLRDGAKREEKQSTNNTRNDKIKDVKNLQKGKEVPKSGRDLLTAETQRVLCFLCRESKMSVKACKKHICRDHEETQSRIRLMKTESDAAQSSPTVEGMLDLCDDILEEWDSILQEDASHQDGDHSQERLAKYRLLSKHQSLELMRTVATYVCSVCAQVFELQTKCVDHMKREHLPYQINSRSHYDVVMTLVPSDDGKGEDGNNKKKIMILYQVKKDITDKLNHGKFKRRSQAWKQKGQSGVRIQAAPNSCPACKRLYKGRKKYLQSHISTKHCGYEPNLSCESCLRANTLRRENRLGEVIQSLNKAYDHKSKAGKPHTKYCTVQYHECIVCGKVFGLYTHLTRHRSLHKTFSCRSCGLICRGYLSLCTHSQTHNKGPLECGQCPRTFYSSYNYLRHAMTHQSQLSCNKCSRVFSRHRLLQQHKEHCLGRTSGRKCKQCGKKRKCRCKNLKLTKKHQSPKPEKQAAATNKNTNLWTKKESKRRYVCDVCGKKFPNTIKVKFFAHLRTHTTNPLHKCLYCYKGWFTTADNLAQHVLEKHKKKQKKLVKAVGGRPYACRECGKGCCKLSAFKRHLSTHQDKPFVCDWCYNLFATHKELAQHMWNIHRTIVCDVCGEVFKYMFQLMEHSQRQEPCLPAIVPQTHKKKRVVTQRSLSDKPFACDTCNESFKRHKELAQHKWNVYRTLVCDVCGKLFKFRYELMEHHFQRVPCIPAKAPDVQKKEPQKAVKSRPAAGSLAKGKDNATSPVKRGRKKKETKKNEKKYKAAQKQDLQEQHRENEAQCSKCKRKFSSETFLQNHVSRIKAAPHSCEPCCRTFKDAGALARHKDYHKRMVYSCDQCKKVFSQTRSLELHKALEHKKKLDLVSSYPSCKLCGQTFITDAVLDSHRCTARIENRQQHPLTITPPKTKVKTSHKISRCHLCGYTCEDDALLASHECKAFRSPTTDNVAPMSRIGLTGSITSVQNLTVVEQAPENLEAYVAKFGQEKFVKEFVQCKQCKEWFASSLQLSNHKCRPKRPYRAFANATPPVDRKRDCKRPVGKTTSASSPRASIQGNNISPSRQNQSPFGNKNVKNDQQGNKTLPPYQNQLPIRTNRRQEDQQVVNLQQTSSIPPPSQSQVPVSTSNTQSEGQVVYLQCEKCHYKFTDVGELASHPCIYMMQDQGAYVCKKCNNIFSSKLELIVHDTQMHNATFFNI